MSTLGIGVRVWVGWCPAHENVSGIDACCKAGTIVDGPCSPGPYAQDDGTGYDLSATGWVVNLDAGDGVLASEHVLTPIDAGEDAVHEPNEQAVST